MLHPEDDRSTTMTSEPFMVLRRPPLPPETYGDQEKKVSKFFVGFLTAGQVGRRETVERQFVTTASFSNGGVGDEVETV